MPTTPDDRADAHPSRRIAATARARWKTDLDVVAGRSLDFTQKFLPDDISLAPRLRLSCEAEARLLNRIQARTYVNLVGFLARSIRAGLADVRIRPWRGGPWLAALGRVGADELEDPGEAGGQALFGRLEAMMAAGMPAGYAFTASPDRTGDFMRGHAAWAALALACCLGNAALAHGRRPAEPDAALSPLFRDVLANHWREASRRAILDELAWRREHAMLAAARRDAAVDDLIALVARLDGLLRDQATSDAAYFAASCGRAPTGGERMRVEAHVLAAYRWQSLVSGMQEPRYTEVLEDLVTPAQMRRIGRALAPMVDATRWAS